MKHSKLTTGLPCGAIVAAAVLSVLLLFCYLISFASVNITDQRKVTASLQQIGEALRQYHAEFGSFPPTWIRGADGRPWHSWRILILPQLGHKELFQSYRFDEPWDSLSNRKLWGQIPEVYRYPISTIDDDSSCVKYLAVVGQDTAWAGTQSVRLNEISVYHLAPAHVVGCRMAALAIMVSAVLGPAVPLAKS